ncbi:TIGR02452 family protein [Micromonospora sp. DT43]|uniref:TIGR02452 family protein n=1 Tax=Micromonospora sp. DT43 TaxID=3393440 RepID=UPI003CF605F4
MADSGRYRNAAGAEVGIGEMVRAAVAGTRLHLPHEVPAAGDAEPGEGRVEVTNESTLQAARRLAPGAACLVFASAKNPGGGFLSGAQAQEESVARSSALYPCLLAAPQFYAFHSEQRDLRYSDRVIFSPDVPVFRDYRGDLLDQPYTTSFLTAAAPNLGAILRNQPDHVADVPAVLARRARRVLEVAAGHGQRTLVLGAWGCGVFRNDPATVADAFAAALREVDRFDHVVFAIRDNVPGTPVLRTFAERFPATPADPAVGGERR